MMVKVFLETFKNQKNPQTNFKNKWHLHFSILDREDILEKD